MQLQESEEEQVQTLTSITQVDTETARRVYIKHNRNIDQAAEALLTGDTGEDNAWTQRQNTPEPRFYEASENPPIRVTPAPGGTAIDLTGDDNPYQTIPASTFGPSNRAPDPNWQMVSSNAPVENHDSTSGISQDDRVLNEAIQASLNDHFVTEEKEEIPLIQQLREGGRPIALRPLNPSHVCAALVVHATFHVPQVRAAVGLLHLPDIPVDVPLDHPARAVWNLIELYTNMDLAQLASLVDSTILPSLESEADRDRADTPAERSTVMVKALGESLEAHLSGQREDDTPARLFGFEHVHVEFINRMPPKISRRQKTTIAPIEVGGPMHENDLISRLTSSLSYMDDTRTGYDVIVDPSQMIGFSLHRKPHDKKGDSIPFSFPKSFYLDRFMFQNLESVNRKRIQEQEYLKEIKELTTKREALTKLNHRDTVQDLKSTIHYYENVTRPDSSRKPIVDATVAQLKDILLMVESKVEGIDRRLRELETLVENIYNVPELQRHQYDLRAVLMHTGLPGRKQMYTYVQDVDDTWWKSCDADVTETTEEAVLSDPAGLHLSAGPFLLLYSAHMSKEDMRRPITWPKRFVDAVDEHNKTFMAMLEADQAAKVKSSKRRSPPIVVSGPRPATPSRSAQLLPQPPRSGAMGPRPANRAKTLEPGSMTVD